MNRQETQPSARERKAGALLQGTQLAVIAGSILMGLVGLCLSLYHGAGLQSWKAAAAFFIYALLISLTVVNGFVFFIILPSYLLCQCTPGRVQAAIAGALGGLFAFGLFSLCVALWSGWDFDPFNIELWEHGMFVGLPWFYWIAGPLYGTLVGLFTAELESGRSRIA